MKIESKYNIGDRVWIVYEDRGEVSVYDTIIDSISVEKDGLCYYTKECNDYLEELLIPYEDTDKLLKKIIKMMNEIHKREKERKIN